MDKFEKAIIEKRGLVISKTIDIEKIIDNIIIDYFLSDRVSRDVIRNGNNQLIRASDELWVFGPISDGVLFEIVYAMNLGMPLKFFTMGTRASEIALVDNINDLTFEPEIHFTGIKKTTLLKQIEDAFLQSKSNSLQLTLGL